MYIIKITREANEEMKEQMQTLKEEMTEQMQALNDHSNQCIVSELGTANIDLPLKKRFWKPKGPL